MIPKLSVLPEKGDYAEAVRPGLVSEAKPLIGRETILVALIREVQDYTILRTEETRELNTVWTPRDASDATPIERVAFLASKQKAAESRELESLLRTWWVSYGMKEPKDWECYLKSQLCLRCPRCILFGATDVSKGTDKGANIKHRIGYGTAFSLEAVDPALREVHTFNGVSEATQLTGQTLGDRESVRPGSLFASIITLRAVTELEFVLALKAIQACTRYGAETRIGGIVRNHVVGLAVAQEEILSPLELTLELAKPESGGSEPTKHGADGSAESGRPAELVPRARVQKILDAFKERAAMPGDVRVLPAEQLKLLLSDLQKVALGKPEVEAAFKAAADFREHQGDYLKKEKKKAD